MIWKLNILHRLLPLRDIVVFPSMVIPLFVGRDKSINALNEVMKGNKKIVLVTQKNSEVDDPKKLMSLLMDAKVQFYNYLNYQTEQ